MAYPHSPQRAIRSRGAGSLTGAAMRCGAGMNRSGSVMATGIRSPVSTSEVICGPAKIVAAFMLARLPEGRTAAARRGAYPPPLCYSAVVETNRKEMNGAE